MKLSLNLIFQTFALIIQAGNFLLPQLTGKMQLIVAFIVSVLQAVVAWRAHYFNPDGTPAAEPYRKF